MNLVIDIGNTLIKSGRFEGNDLIEKRHFDSVQELKKYIGSVDITNIIISSTGPELLPHELSPGVKIYEMNAGLRLPFSSGYSTPETLGADRLAAVAGASYLFPRKNVLTIDLGTCITYDFLNDNNIYLGGAISPGTKMRFRAMKNFTARLPEVPVPSDMPSLTGNSTTSCMASGVMNGMYFEIEGMIAGYNSKYGKIKVIFTGGDAHLFDKKFKGDIFAAPDLVLIGLNVILQHNVAIS